MKKYNLLLIILVYILSINLVLAQNSNTLSSISSVDASSEIKVGIYIISIGKFDVGSGAFTADFYLSLKCDSTCPNQDFEFMNGRASSLDKIVDEPNEKFYRIQANLASPIDLKQFPFDKQQIQIVLEDKKNTVDKVRYVVDSEGTGMDESVVITGWQMGEYDVEVKEHYYSIYDETYSQYVFTIPIYRIILNAIIKTLLPIFFIITVMLSSFILDPDKLSTRIAMVSSALVASVMFHVSLANQIPPVGYLTFMDKFMVLTYFVILISFALNVMLMELTELKKTDLVNKIHTKTGYSVLVIVPILYALLFWLFL
ncbi:MAG: hypothetical protein WC867_08020 [Candidatus Pacearchaeota archaeon]|jgi:hypothetical protein